jgi:hypothetical protein
MALMNLNFGFPVNRPLGPERYRNTGQLVFSNASFITVQLHRDSRQFWNHTASFQNLPFPCREIFTHICCAYYGFTAWHYHVVRVTIA